MRSKSHTEIESISSEFVDEIVKRSGVPDNFVESAEGSFVGLPDLEADPQARVVMGRLQQTVDDLPILSSEDGNGNGAHDPAHRADDEPGESELS